MVANDDKDNEYMKRLKVLMKKTENQSCIDCGCPRPTWATIIQPPNGSPEGSHPIGALCCINCSGSHRRLGVHLTFVRSITLDTWKEKDVIAMENGGNVKVNEIFESYASSSKPTSTSCSTQKSTTTKMQKPTRHTDNDSRLLYVRKKYEELKYFDPIKFATYNDKIGHNHNNKNTTSIKEFDTIIAKNDKNKIKEFEEFDERITKSNNNNNKILDEDDRFGFKDGRRRSSNSCSNNIETTGALIPKQRRNNSPSKVPMSESFFCSNQSTNLCKKDECSKNGKQYCFDNTEATEVDEDESSSKFNDFANNMEKMEQQQQRSTITNHSKTLVVEKKLLAHDNKNNKNKNRNDKLQSRSDHLKRVGELFPSKSTNKKNNWKDILSRSDHPKRIGELLPSKNKNRKDILSRSDHPKKVGEFVSAKKEKVKINRSKALQSSHKASFRWFRKSTGYAMMDQ